MNELELAIGDRCRLARDIFEGGEHAPPGIIGRIGEVVVIRELRPEIPGYSVSHPWITDGRSFWVAQNEVVPLPEGD